MRKKHKKVRTAEGDGDASAFQNGHLTIVVRPRRHQAHGRPAEKVQTRARAHKVPAACSPIRKGNKEKMARTVSDAAQNRRANAAGDDRRRPRDLPIRQPHNTNQRSVPCLCGPTGVSAPAAAAAESAGRRARRAGPACAPTFACPSWSRAAAAGP